MRKITLIIFIALAVLVEKSHLRQRGGEDYGHQQHDSIKIGECERKRKCFERLSDYFRSSFIFNFLFIINANDDDGNSQPVICVCVYECKQQVMFFFRWMNENFSFAFSRFFLSTGGLFDDAQEAEIIFKFAVQKTNERIFNSTLRRLNPGEY